MKKSIWLLVSLLALVWAAPALAADYPKKAVNVVIPFTAGGSTDTQAHIMQKYWNKYAKKPWLFVYKPGAGGLVGFTEIAKARPDGYTIGMLSMPHVILQSLMESAKYKPDSFDYICQVVSDPQCVVVRKDSPYNSTKDLLGAAAQKPGTITMGIIGPLSGHHLMYLDLAKKFPQSKVITVFFKGAADQTAALVGGKVDVILGNVSDVNSSGDHFKVLNVASQKRNAFMPAVHTLREDGIDVMSEIRRCYVTPKGVAPEVMAELRSIFQKINDDTDYRKEMLEAEQFVDYVPGGTLGDYIKQENENVKKQLIEAGLLKK